MGDGHVNIGREDGDEQQRQKPASYDLYPTLGDQQTDTAEKLADAADEDAGAMKGYPGRHDQEERLGMPEMERPGGKKDSGEE